MGQKAPFAKPLKGFGGGGVLEVGTTSTATPIEPFTPCGSVRWSTVLHAFQKKSTRGIQTPKRDLELIKLRLKRASEEYEQWQRNERKESP